MRKNRYDFVYLVEMAVINVVLLALFLGKGIIIAS